MNKTAERALLVRPLAFCLGVLAVVWLNPVLRQDRLFPWLAVILGGPNLFLWVARDLRPLRRAAVIVSPAISLVGWGVLAALTLGLKSPMLAAFFFEVGLATVSMGPRGVVAVTAGGVAVLAGIQFLFGLAAGWPLLALEAGFLAVVGGFGTAMARRRETGERALRVQGEALGQRLEVLQQALADERVVARVGENAARLAHGLKNAVHSLRGFADLIEPEIGRAGASREALAGLKSAIDDLERLARLSLEGPRANQDARTAEPPTGATAASLRTRGPATSASASRGGAAEGPRGRREAGRVVEAVELVVRELALVHPEVAFDLRIAPADRAVAVGLAAAPLQELLTILLRNAIEAMHGVGRCTLELGRRGGQCVIEVRDEGDGLSPEIEARLFTPGFTTKSGGSGFGLFLARRIAMDQGGSLRLEAGGVKGAVAVLALPLVDDAGSDARSVDHG